MADEQADEIVVENGIAGPDPTSAVTPGRIGILGDNDVDRQTPAGGLEHLRSTSSEQAGKNRHQWGAIPLVAAEPGGASAADGDRLAVAISAIESVLVL